MKAKFGTPDFKDFIEKLEKKNKNADVLVKKAILESAKVTQQEIDNATSLQNKVSGQMQSATFTPVVETVGYAQVRARVGFNKQNLQGSLHAIFLNFGTPKRKEHGQVEETKFYTNAIKRTAKARREIQNQIIKDFVGSD